MIFKLNNPVKNFQWGSKSLFMEMFGVANPSMQPQAELWMGAHPNGSSSVLIEGREVTLFNEVQKSPEVWLGKYSELFGQEFPFLVKLLAVSQPLSVQVHPSKGAAEIGFSKEIHKGIAINAPERNYKDPNHKPELVYAVTPYLAMNGFRNLEAINNLFSIIELPSIVRFVHAFTISPNKKTLENLFTAILQLDFEEKEQAIKELLSFNIPFGACHELIIAIELITDLAELYPNDIGLFSPLFLNIIELQPGEAMFLYAETPHAYLRGVAVEVMANSDNVLRAGLTPKHIDIPELIANTRFDSINKFDLRMQPIKKDARDIYPVPVGDFKFDVVRSGLLNVVVSSPEILLCIEGRAEIEWDSCTLVLESGDSVVVAAITSDYKILCKGVIIRAYC